MVEKSQYQRILIENSDGICYRLCNFFHHSDKYGELYIKFLFPDLREFPMVKKDLKNPTIQKFKNGLGEISFHYIANISTFKNKRARLDTRGIPSISDKGYLPLFTLTIFQLSAFKEFDINKRTTNDLTVSRWDNRVRSLTFYLSRVKVLPKLSKDLTLLDPYIFPTKNSVNTHLLLFDCFSNNMIPAGGSPIRITSVGFPLETPIFE